MATVNTGDNRYGVAQFIVAPTIAEGANFTTIAAALTAASSGNTIFIRPGTYTENLTLKAGVNLTAFVCDSSQNATGKVIISGTCTFSAAGSVSISGIQLQTNSAALLAVTGSELSIVNLSHCYLNMTNSTGITYSSSSASSAINIMDCSGNLGTTGIGIFAHSSSGTLSINNSVFSNSGASQAASTISAGLLFTRYSIFANPITSSGTGGVFIEYTGIDTSTQNVTALTHGGSVASNSIESFYYSGTASAVSIGGTLNMMGDAINSSNTNAVTGGGTIGLGSITFVGTSSLINTTTQTLLIHQAGQYKGRTSASAPSVGMIGEQLRAVNTAGTAYASATPTNITSIVLTAGIWDVSGMITTIFTGTATVGAMAVNTTTANLGTLGDNQCYFTSPTALTSSISLSVPAWRVSTTGATAYLVAQATFSSGTATSYGRIVATRVG